MPTDLLNVRFGARFLFVTVLPNVAFAALVGGLVACGAPGTKPSWSVLDQRMHQWPPAAWLLAGLTVVVVSVAIYPLTYPLVQLVEGYWQALPHGRRLQRAAAKAKTRERKSLVDWLLNADPRHVGPEEMADAAARLDWLPSAEHEVLPTTLGNVLFAGEVRAGARYGYETATIWPRLVPLVGDDLREQITAMRNQLDASVRLAVLSLVAVPITAALLIHHGAWLLLPMACYLFAWASYRAAVAAAKRFSDALAVAFDLHRLDLWDALSLTRPSSMEDELITRAPALSAVLADRSPEPADRRALIFARTVRDLPQTR